MNRTFDSSPQGRDWSREVMQILDGLKMLLRKLLAGVDLKKVGAPLLVVSVGILFGSYFVLRYGGYWAENDSAFFVSAIEQLKEHKTIIYPGGYTHGFTYSVWASMLSLITGVSTGELLRVYTPILGNVLVALLAFASFRRFLGTNRLGLLAAAFLFLVPELVFTASRGNHEKLSIALILLASLSILQSTRALYGHQQTMGKGYVSWTLVFYIASFALVSTNIIFGLALLSAWTFAASFLLLLALRPSSRQSAFRVAAQKLSMMTGTAWLAAFIILWFIYPPMKTDLLHIRTSLEGIFDFVAVESEVSGRQPYQAIQQSWVSQPVYLALSFSRWVLFVCSGIAATVLLFRGLVTPRTLSVARAVLLGMYIALGLELTVTVIADFSGLSFGDNLQVRFFTYFTLFAAPLAVLFLVTVMRSLSGLIPSNVLRIVLISLVVFFAGASLVKATLDPSVSNLWIFYHPDEIEALRTWASHVERKQIYVGWQVRMWPAWIMSQQIGMPRKNFPDSFIPAPQTGYAFDSAINRAQVSAWVSPLSPLLMEDRVYDNGLAQIYHKTPSTPHQY